MDKNIFLLYGITERSYLKNISLEEAVEQALLGGITILQLREKQMDEKTLCPVAIRIRDLCHSYGVPFILNDHVRIAAMLDCDGVHVGQNDMDPVLARKILGPGKIIGVTAKTVEQAQRAEAAGADYLGSGALFVTGTKKDAKPMAKKTLQEIAESVHIPVVGIGGITAENISSLKGTGIAGVAVAGGIFNTPDIRRACTQLKQATRDL